MELDPHNGANVIFGVRWGRSVLSVMQEYGSLALENNSADLIPSQISYPFLNPYPKWVGIRQAVGFQGR